MHLSDYFGPDSFSIIEKSLNKQQLLEELVTRVVNQIPDLDKKAIMDALLKREKQCSTGIGGGIAIPHAIVDKLSNTIILCALVPSGLDFKALDKKPVNFIFLLLSPEKERGLHIKMLARISRIASCSDFIDKIIASHNPAEIYECLCKEDQSHI